jgi:hypothetical protein
MARADRCRGGVEVGGERGDAPAVVQQGLQAAAKVGEAQPSGLLVELMVVAADAEAALDGQAATQTSCWEWFPCAPECRVPHHSGRPAIIRTSMQTAHC